jgi:hypothetical protein
MQLSDIASRVAFKLDDPDQTYVTPDYVAGFAQDVYEWLYNKLRLTGNQFAEEAVIVPNVNAGIPTLDGYMAAGQLLATLLQPRMIRWRLPGQDASFFRRADGPLDAVRDLPNGIPVLDSWAFLRQSIKLSNFSTALDLEVTGDFLFDPLVAPESQLQIAMNMNRCFSCKLASEIGGKARGNDKWQTTYEADADDALDDLAIAMTKANQGKTERVARMSRVQAGAAGQILGTH